MYKTLRLHRRLFIAATLLLFLSFAFNIFGAGKQSWFENFQKDSESLVTNKIVCREQLGRDGFGGQLVRVQSGHEKEFNNDSPACSAEILEGYVSQYGFQGKFSEDAFRVAHKLTGISAKSFSMKLELFFALLTALTLSLFVVWVRKEFDQVTAITVLIALSLSTWIIGYGRNLYWATPLLFLPLVFTLYYADSNVQWRKRWLFFVGVGVLMYLRFLNGYEFVPTIMLSVLAGSSYYIYKYKGGLQKLFSEACIVFVVGLVAFLCAFGTHFYQVYRYTGNGHEALNLIKGRALERTTHNGDFKGYVYAGLQVTLPDIYQMANQYIDLGKASESRPLLLTNAVSVINYALLPVIEAPVSLKTPFATLAQSFTAVAIASFFALRAIRRRARGLVIQKVAGLNAAMLVGLAAALSWLVLARGHSYVHAHLNGIVYYIPFMLFAYIAVGLWVSNQILLLKTQLSSKKKV